VKALALLALVVLAAPALAPYDPGRQFPGYPYAPPMRPHLADTAGAWHRPFAYPVRVEDPIERTYAEDRTRRIDSFAHAEPWFLLGSDGLGRDVLSRVLIGARHSPAPPRDTPAAGPTPSSCASPIWSSSSPPSTSC